MLAALALAIALQLGSGPMDPPRRLHHVCASNIPDWICEREYEVPNSELTPGLVRPLSVEQVCSIKWGRDVRHVTQKMRRYVFKSYRIPYSRHRRYELDHLIPRSLGGADNVLNLWPEPLSEARHAKDPLEVRLHKMVCNGELTLAFAQEAIRTDWRAAYRLYVEPNP